MKTQTRNDKWLVVYDDGQEVLDGLVSKDRFDAMELVQKAGEVSGGEIGANVVPLELAAAAPQLLEALKEIASCSHGSEENIRIATRILDHLGVEVAK